MSTADTDYEKLLAAHELLAKLARYILRETKAHDRPHVATSFMSTSMKLRQKKNIVPLEVMKNSLLSDDTSTPRTVGTLQGCINVLQSNYRFELETHEIEAMHTINNWAETLITNHRPADTDTSVEANRTKAISLLTTQLGEDLQKYEFGVSVESADNTTAKKRGVRAGSHASFSSDAIDSRAEWGSDVSR
jgi:hypothetical protein